MSSCLSHERYPHRETGIAIIEMAVVLPILALFVLAIAELGRGLYEYNTLAKAVRDSARYLTTNIYDGDGTEPPAAAVINEANNLVVCGRPNCSSQPSLLPNLTSNSVYAGTYGGSTDSDAGTLSCDDVRAGDSADLLTVVVCVEYTFVPVVGAALSGIGFTMRPTVFMGVL